MAKSEEDLKIPMRNAMAHLTCNIKMTGMKKFSIRCWIAEVFIYVAMRIVGLKKENINIE